LTLATPRRKFAPSADVSLHNKPKAAMSQPPETFTKAQELRSLVFLTAVLAPLLAVALVGGYGFIVWMVQLFTGPPGH
jgi:nitrate reductase NapE